MMGKMNIAWQCKAFNELTPVELYKIIQLRIEVFSIEQNVIYQDCDNKDFKSYHLFSLQQNEIAGYSRLLPIGLAYSDAASFGRVVTATAFRRQQLGKKL